MKKMLMAIIALASVSASAEYVTVTLCGEQSEQGANYCRTITYKVRPASPVVPTECTVSQGEAGQIPCPTKYGVPSFLKKANQWFLDHGFTPVDNSTSPNGPG